jgi:alpha-glucosidase
MRRIMISAILLAALATVACAHVSESTCLCGSSGRASTAAEKSLDHTPSQPLRALSPDGTLEVEFAVTPEGPAYRLFRNHHPLVEWSAMGFDMRDTTGKSTLLGPGMTVVATARRTFDETWTQPWGEKKQIRDNHNEVRIDLRETGDAPREMTIVFRVFDDGVGFRYEWPDQPHLGAFEIMDERTEFALAGNFDTWSIPAYQRDRYEYLFTRSPVGALGKVHTPLTMKTPDGVYLSIHEAALVDFSSMVLNRTGDVTLHAELVPWSDGVKVRASAPHRSPWRTVQVADSPGGLITSYLILNLNEPNALGDVSWVKPMKYMGIWWEMHIRTATWGIGPQHGATTANSKKYIDFAAEHGIDGVLIEGWNQDWNGQWRNGGEGFDFLTPYPDFDLPGVARYAADKGVELIGHHETGGGVQKYERQMKDAFALYQSLGVRAVKTGYVAWGQGIPRFDDPDGTPHREWHHGQFMVRHHQYVVEEAARHRISINIHEPIKDTGLRRTYPNLVTREGARGQEYNAWSADGGNPPDHTAILPFTRMLSGPMDFTPGAFDLILEHRPDNRVSTTLAKQLALYVVLFSPLQMASDLPENYEKRLDASRFIKIVPVDWEDTRVLHGEIGDFITVVRKDRNGPDWYMGSLTDENGRTFQASLDFLDPGRRYIAEIYRDGPEAHWKTRPYDIVIEEMPVDATMILTLHLAPGGGQAIRFRAVD